MPAAVRHGAATTAASSVRATAARAALSARRVPITAAITVRTVTAADASATTPGAVRTAAAATAPATAADRAQARDSRATAPGVTEIMPRAASVPAGPRTVTADPVSPVRAARHAAAVRVRTVRPVPSPMTEIVRAAGRQSRKPRLTAPWRRKRPAIIVTSIMKKNARSAATTIRRPSAHVVTADSSTGFPRPCRTRSRRNRRSRRRR